LGTFILDGFPRTPRQAEMLEMLAQEQGKTIQAILVDIPLDHLEKRMTGRRSCPVCGEIYNVYFKAPKFDNVCDFHPETPLAHRADDTEEKVKVRLATYNEQTKPLLDYYEKSGRLQKVNGSQAVEAIYGELEQLI
jgi:adenylate kinase